MSYQLGCFCQVLKIVRSRIFLKSILKISISFCYNKHQRQFEIIFKPRNSTFIKMKENIDLHEMSFQKVCKKFLEFLLFYFLMIFGKDFH